jgi:hypothetical protein
MTAAKRRFAINPGPLKVVPASQRQPFAKPGTFADVGRCEAELKDGSGRCLNDGKTIVAGRWLCGVHARPATAPQNHIQRDDDAAS